MLLLGLLLQVMGASQALAATPLTLENIQVTPEAKGSVQIRLRLSGPAPDTSSFTIDNPARLAVDLPNTKLGDVKTKQVVDTGVARNLRLIEAGNRTRMIIGLTHMVPYEIRSQANLIFINLKQAAAPSVVRPGEQVPSAITNSITKIDFRRTAKGDGRVIIKLSDPSVVVDSHREGGKLIVDFLNTTLPQRLQRRLDVTDFATPVSAIEAYPHDGSTRIAISTSSQYEQLAYQVGDTYSIDIRALSKEKQQAQAGKKGAYKGEKLSLNFQNIDVRAVLQLIADFTGLNIVASDTVQGNITLRLKNVPWDQALDIVLKAKGLDMRRSGNVIMVAPAEEIAAREKQELEAKQQMEKLAPLETEFFQINYAKAADIASLLKAEANSMLSERGNVTVDARTNTLMILDTRDKLAGLRKVIAKLDVPVRQVLIESRIVVANDDYSKDLGARFGVTNVADNGSNGIIATTGSNAGTDTMVNSAINNLQTNGQTAPVSVPSAGDRLNVNLPASGPAGKFALAILGSDYLVDLELSALQQEGKGEVVSNPRVITSNQKEAVIEQGVEVPYQKSTSSGATSVAFKKAVLSLNVTPQITPDDRIIMDLRVSKDSVGQVVSGVPTINTREVNTQVLVNNGDTVVLGGIYEQTRSKNLQKVPLLGDIPLLGALFRSTTTVNNKAELLIFVTPKILKEGLKAKMQ